MAATYIEVPADDLLNELREVGRAIVARGGKVEEKIAGREVVFDLTPPDCPTVVRVYTSLARGSSAVRACGKDAIRLVLGFDHVDDTKRSGFRPVSKGRRVFRTAPNKDHAGWLNTNERVATFLARLKQAIREAYLEALNAPTCHVCGEAPVARRETKSGNRKFLGCTRFPECKGTRPLPPGG